MRSEIILGGVTFRVLDKTQAEPLFAGLLNFAGEPLVEWGFSLPEIENACFLVADESVEMDSLALDVHLPEAYAADDAYVLGLIFRKDLHVRHGVVGFDTDHSPLLIVHGNLAAQNVYLFGNAHYVGGDLRCESLLGDYNHGALWVHGNVSASLVYADDMELHLGRLDDVPTVHSLGGSEVRRRASPGEAAGDTGSVSVPNRGRLAEVVNPEFLEDRPDDGEEGADPHQIDLGWACAQIERGGSLLRIQG